MENESTHGYIDTMGAACRLLLHEREARCYLPFVMKTEGLCGHDALNACSSNRF